MFKFPILRSSRKKIPVKPLVRKVHNICNGRLLITTNIIEFQKSLQESTAPTPHMMPKFNSAANANLELNGFWKDWPTLSYGSPKTNTTRIRDFFSTPTSPIIPIFYLNNCLQRWVDSLPYLHSHFPNKTWLKALKFLIPKLPDCKGEQTWAHFTSRNLGDSSIARHRKFLWSLSKRIAISTGIGKSDRK